MCVGKSVGTVCDVILTRTETHFGFVGNFFVLVQVFLRLSDLNLFESLRRSRRS